MSEKETSTGETAHIVLLQALGRTPGRVAQFADGLPEEALVWQPSGGEWSISMTLAHLDNSERLLLARLEFILGECEPLVRSFGPEEARPESHLAFDELLAAFRERRRQTLDLLYRLRPEDWQRKARHEKHGPTTMLKQVQGIANHDTSHLGQIHDAREQWLKNHKPAKEVAND